MQKGIQKNDLGDIGYKDKLRNQIWATFSTV